MPIYVIIKKYDIRAENILITDNDIAKIANFEASRSINNLTRNLKATIDRYCAAEKLLLKKNMIQSVKFIALVLSSFASPLSKEYRELAEQDTFQNDELPSQIWIKKSIKNKFITDIKWNDLVESVGTGRFGVVYKTYWKKVNKEVVYKRLILDNIDAIQHEIQIQTRYQKATFIALALLWNMLMVVTYLTENFRTLEWDKKLQLAFDYGNANKSNIHNDVFGIIPYLSPELFNSNNQLPSYSAKTDIYRDKEKVIPNTPYYCELYISCRDTEPVKKPDIEHVHLELYNMLHKDDENDGENTIKLFDPQSS
ncbi:4740_t:CDS:2, partial [Funneliformis geosporum]